jgi:chromosome segregation ATPase
MQSLSEDEKRQVLGKVLADQLSAIQEAVKDVPEIKIQLEKLDRTLSDMGADLKVVKAAITDLSNQVNNHERQIERLQAA